MKSKRRNYRGYYYKIEIAPHFDSYDQNKERDIYITLNFTKPHLYFFQNYIGSEAFFGSKGDSIPELIKKAVSLAHKFIDSRVEALKKINNKDLKALMDADGMEMIAKLDKI